MTHRQQKHRTRHPLLRWLAALIALGILLVSVFFRNRIARAQYPCRYADMVTRYAEMYDLDPLVLYAFIRTESNFNPNAQSDAGARGLMQITEVTFDWIKLKIAPDEALTFDDLFDPETNIRFGSYFVAYCLQRYGTDLATAAAAYHSGVGTVNELLADSACSPDGQTLSHYPYPQMRRSVHKITTAYQRYQEIYSDP